MMSRSSVAVSLLLAMMALQVASMLPHELMATLKAFPSESYPAVHNALEASESSTKWSKDSHVILRSGGGSRAMVFSTKWLSMLSEGTAAEELPEYGLSGGAWGLGTRTLASNADITLLDWDRYLREPWTSTTGTPSGDWFDKNNAAQNSLWNKKPHRFLGDYFTRASGLSGTRNGMNMWPYSWEWATYIDGAVKVPLMDYTVEYQEKCQDMPGSEAALPESCVQAGRKPQELCRKLPKKALPKASLRQGDTINIGIKFKSRDTYSILTVNSVGTWKAYHADGSTSYITKLTWWNTSLCTEPHFYGNVESRPGSVDMPLTTDLALLLSSSAWTGLIQTLWGDYGIRMTARVRVGRGATDESVELFDLGTKCNIPFPVWSTEGGKTYFSFDADVWEKRHTHGGTGVNHQLEFDDAGGGHVCLALLKNYGWSIQPIESHQGFLRRSGDKHWRDHITQFSGLGIFKLTKAGQEPSYLINFPMVQTTEGKAPDVINEHINTMGSGTQSFYPTRFGSPEYHKVVNAAQDHKDALCKMKSLPKSLCPEQPVSDFETANP